MATSDLIFKMTRVIPVIVLDDYRHAIPLGKALLAAGLPVAEVTLRTPQSWQAIESMREVEGLQLGVGSVKSSSDIKRAKEIGVSFAVSPGFTTDIGKAAIELDLPFFPGVSTPSEILSAMSLGLSVLKWFPAESLGGVSTLKAVAAPFPGLRFIPTGGIGLENVHRYLEMDCVAAVGGSWMVSREKLKLEKFEEIEVDIRNAVSVVGRN